MLGPLVMPPPTQPSPTRGEGLNLPPSPLVGEGRGGGADAGRRLLNRVSGTEEPDEETMLRWVVLAYPDRVTRRRGGEATG